MTELNILFEFKFGAWCDGVFLVAIEQERTGRDMCMCFFVVVAVFVFNLLYISKFKCCLSA